MTDEQVKILDQDQEDIKNLTEFVRGFQADIAGAYSVETFNNDGYTRRVEINFGFGSLISGIDFRFFPDKKHLEKETWATATSDKPIPEVILTGVDSFSFDYHPEKFTAFYQVTVNGKTLKGETIFMEIKKRFENA